jgi:hypothetical protein
MTPETIDAISNGVRVVIEFLTVTGLGAAALKMLKAKGVDVQRIQNNNLVQAAENAAQPLIMDLVVKGKSITDPTVLSDVTLALKASLLATHAQTAAAIGAAPADVERIASNAVGKVALAVTSTAAAAPVAPVATPAPSIAEAAQVLTDAKAALAQAGIMVSAPVQAPAAAT